jgi:hypothetical protein
VFKYFLCLALPLLGIGCVNDSSPTPNNPRVPLMHSLVFLNGNDTNDVELLVRKYADDPALGDTLLHQFVAPGKSSGTLNLESMQKFRYALYWADSTYDSNPIPSKRLAEHSYWNSKIFLDADSAHYEVSMRGDVVTFTGSN